jgi:hypothetical protein
VQASVSMKLRVLGVCLLLGACFEPGKFSPVSHPGHDAGQPEDRDAGTDAGEPVDAASALQPAKHAQCLLSVGDKLPAEPRLTQSKKGAYPQLNEWTSLECPVTDPEERGTCNAVDPCPVEFSLCLRPEKGEGLCLSNESQEVPLGYGDEQCVAFAAAWVKAQLCCAKTPGIDCRTWPFHGTSKPGQICALHADCEPGLWCQGGLYDDGPSPANGGDTVWGRCTCPGVDVEEVLIPSACAEVSSPNGWLNFGGDYGTCTPAPADGYRIDAMQDSFGFPPSSGSVAYAADFDELDTARVLAHWNSQLVLLTASAQDGVWSAGGDAWTYELLADAPDISEQVRFSAALFVDGEKTVHAAMSHPLAVVERKAGGKAELQPLQGDARLVDLTVAADGTLYVAYLALGMAEEGPYDVMLAQRVGDAFTSIKVADGALVAKRLGVTEGVSEGGLFLSLVDNQPEILFAKSDGIYRARLKGADFELSRVARGLYFRAARDASGVLDIVSELPLDETIPLNDRLRKVLLTRVQADGPHEMVVWTQPSIHYERDLSYPAIAKDAAGKRWIAQRSPTGLLLWEEGVNGFESRQLSDTAKGLMLALDHGGAPHAFFWFQLIGGEASGDLFYHAHQGSCW